MALFPKLEMRQGQNLVMTPQLQQAIKLLQLSNIDLSAYVENELERNPLLERDEKNEFTTGSDNLEIREGNGTEPPREGVDQNLPGEPEMLDLGTAAGLKDIDSKLDTSLENVFPDDQPVPIGTTSMAPELKDSGWTSLGPAHRGAGPFSEDESFEASLSEPPSLAGHLTEQLHVSITDPVQQMIGAFLIDMVSEDGYLRGDLEVLAEQLGAPLELVENILKRMQEFDPPGVFARDLTECLTLQLAEQNRLDPVIHSVLDNLDLLAKRDFAKLARMTGLGQSELMEIVNEIRNLNPKPGHIFGTTLIQPVVPDVFVREGPDGNWLVELNSDTLPRVLVNRQYFTTVSNSAMNKEDKTYLSECLSNASWLVKSLDQRARTILKTAREIVRQQDAFLTKGVQYLKPMNLKMVADAVSMHESTISRVTSNKYISTPRGVFELKYFFSSSIAAADGAESFAAEAVRHRIQELIDAESPDSILSDDKLVALLREKGIVIARRTVAKYREAMKIPSSVQRRREKRNPL